MSQLIDPKTWKPRTPAVAQLALEKGVGLHDLNLNPDEAALIVSGAEQFPFLSRITAAKHLARAYAWAKAANLETREERELDLCLHILQEVQRAREPLEFFTTISGKGRPRRVEPWVPWQWDWNLILRWYLGWALRKNYVRPREKDATTISLAHVLHRDDSGEELTFADVISDGGDGPEAVLVGGKETARLIALRGSAWAHPRQALRGSDAWGVSVRGASPGYAEALKVRTRDPRGLANPDLPKWMLDKIRRDLEQRRPGVTSARADEQTRTTPHQDNIDFVARERAKGRMKEEEEMAEILEAVREDGEETRKALRETNRLIEEVASLIVYLNGEMPADEAERFLSEQEGG